MQSVLQGVFTLQLHPIHHGQGFFLNCGSSQHGQLRHTHRVASWTAGHLLLTSISAFLLPFWMTGWSDDWMTGHVTSFFCIQFAIQCSINRDAYRYVFRYMIQFSDSHFFISPLASSPLLGTKLCHILDLYM